MENDKELKDILAKWATEKTSENFTSKTMQAITALHEQQPARQVGLYKGLRMLSVFAIIIVVLSLAVAGTLTPAVSIRVEFDGLVDRLSSATVYNMLSFIASLWLLLLINKGYEKRQLNKKKFENYA